MKIEVKVGDIFTSDADILIHACNDSGVMGAGIAKSIKQIYPKAFAGYYHLCEISKNNRITPLGKCAFVEVNKGRYVANLICGSLDFGIYYNSLHNSLIELKNYLTMLNKLNLKIAIPDLIGAGLFGGNRDQIHTIIENVFSETDCEIEYWIYNK